jgi:hypothetical protein
MDKEKIKGQANIDIFNLRKAQEQGVITEFGKGKLEALEGIVDFIDSMQEEPVSEEMEEAAEQDVCEVVNECSAIGIPNDQIPSWVQDAMINEFIHGAKWKAENLWKPADGDDLPYVDREVIAILDNGKVVFAHRPPEFWDGKNIITGKVTRYYPKTYGKGGWNIQNIVYWLDVELPKEIGL